MHYLLPTLKDLGLSDKEAKIYLTLLSIGMNPASTIAKKANENRSSCYSSLEKLMQRGFIQQIIKNNTSYFSAIEPKYLLSHLRIKYEELAMKMDFLQKNLHTFENVKNPESSSSKVRFFEGKGGIQNVFEDTLEAKDTLRVYASVEKLEELLYDYLYHYYPKRIQKGIQVKAIYPESKRSIIHKNRDTDELRKSKLIPEVYNFPLDIFIYNSKLVIISLQEQFGIIIENKEIADAQKKIFDTIWEKL